MPMPTAAPTLLWYVETLVDSFEEAGSGFGRTYDFPYFPFRIDYILADPYFKITSHKVYTGRDYSDHFPIRATLKKRQ